MKKTILFLLLFAFSSTHINAQNEPNRIVGEILEALEATQAINDLIKNKAKVESELQDINRWAAQNKISPTTYALLNSSFNTYRMHVNNVVGQIGADMRSFRSVKQLKGQKLQNWIKKANEAYEPDLKAAGDAYNNTFVPAYNSASKEAGSKSLIGVAAIILRYAPAIIGIVKNVIEKRRIDAGTQELAIKLAMDAAFSKIKKRVSYKPWSHYVTNTTDGSALVGSFSDTGILRETEKQKLQIGLNTEVIPAPQYRAVDGSLSILINDKVVPIQQTPSKFLEVVTKESSSSNLPKYEVRFANGTTFQVNVEGYEYAAVYAWDERDGKKYWTNFTGKFIDVVNESVGADLEGKSYQLPSSSTFFRVNGTTGYDQMVVILSNSPLDANRLFHLNQSTAVGEDFLGEIEKQFIRVAKPSDNAITSTTVNKIKIKKQANTQIVIPIYLRINKR